MSLGDTSKYIQRLVRVISEKEKMIDQLRRENKDCARINEGRSEAEISMVQQRLKEELSAVNAQVKKLLGKLDEMEVHINQLNSGLQEEIALNQQLQNKINQSSHRQIQLLGQIAVMKEHFDRSNHDLLSRYEAQKKKTRLLEIELEGLHHKIEQQKRLDDKIEEYASKIERYQNEMKSVAQYVEGIFTLIRKENLGVCDCQHQEYGQEQTSMSYKLSKIQAYVNEKIDQDRSNFFNQTIDGISIIMKSFEEKLEEVQCLTDRQALGCVKHHSLKESSRSVPPLLSSPQRPVHNSSKETDPTLDTGSF